MRFAVDTNKYIDFCQNDPETVKIFQQASEIFIPFIVLGEVRSGFMLSKNKEKNEQNLIRFLSLSDIHILKADEQTTFFYASLVYELRKKGTPIPTNDLWIAALALQHQLVLYSRDHHFTHIPQLARLT